jgi:hypothetical protein
MNWRRFKDEKPRRNQLCFAGTVAQWPGKPLACTGAPLTLKEGSLGLMRLCIAKMSTWIP